jgi:hypothetical protein
MHSEVLDVLDAHLGELLALRRDLVAARPIDLGERRQIATAAVASSRRCAQGLSVLLAGDRLSPAGDPGAVPGRSGWSARP